MRRSTLWVEDCDAVLCGDCDGDEPFLLSDGECAGAEGADADGARCGFHFLLGLSSELGLGAEIIEDRAQDGAFEGRVEIEDGGGGKIRVAGVLEKKTHTVEIEFLRATAC